MKTVNIEKITNNIMGTASIVMQIQGMRKPQEFTIYPIAKDETGKIITIQSDTRIGRLNMETGTGQISKSHANGAYFPHLMMDKLELFQITPLDLQTLRMKIFTTADSEAGNSVVYSDNSGAFNII